MKCKQYSGIFILLFGSITSINTIAATPGASMLANTCAGCHGTNGSSVGPASPTIAGISVDYFIETMQAYKKAERPSTIMSRIAKGYSDEEIKLMANFFAKQKFVRQPQQHNAQLAKKGKKLHKKYCEKCHEDEGASSEDDAGILAGQWQAYLRYSMQDFTSGKRSMEKKMKKKMQSLDEDHGADGIDALIHYYSSQM
ncbi:MAG: cytochrome c4 [Gammaproteobacteria bacterium]|nr:cytochrome c4 [Gammaproteobacteria bacterium]